MTGKMKQTAHIQPYQSTPCQAAAGQYHNVTDVGGFANRGYLSSTSSMTASPVHQQQHASQAMYSGEACAKPNSAVASAMLSEQDNFDLSRVSKSPRRMQYSRIPRTACDGNVISASHQRGLGLTQHDSLGEVGAKVRAVLGQVHGVTDEECMTSLQANQWHVDASVRYLKVEQLFRLSIATKEKCQKLLELFNWNLETAGSALLDEYRSGSSV